MKKLLLFLVVALATLVLCSAFVAGLFAAPATYTSAVYDDYGKPVEGCDVECWPKLFVWGEGEHGQNLVGVCFWFWNPPPPTNVFVDFVPKSHRSILVNYWGPAVHTPEVGDTLAFSGYTPRTFHPSDWVDDPDTTTVKGGRAVVLAVEDSVVSLRATIVIGSRTWTRDVVDTTYARLVPENYRR